MARITIEDCLEKIDNRFELVIVASKRARNISAGTCEPYVPQNNDKPTVIALREIAEGFIGKEYMNVVVDSYSRIDSELDVDFIKLADSITVDEGIRAKKPSREYYRKSISDSEQPDNSYFGDMSLEDLEELEKMKNIRKAEGIEEINYNVFTESDLNDISNEYNHDKDQIEFIGKNNSGKIGVDSDSEDY